MASSTCRLLPGTAGPVPALLRAPSMMICSSPSEVATPPGAPWPACGSLFRYIRCLGFFGVYHADAMVPFTALGLPFTL